MSETKKVLLITGGTRGVGAATARLAAAQGWSVCINYLQDEPAASALSQEIRNSGNTVHACRADVGKEADVVRLFAECDAALGAVSALVCNATSPVSRLPVDHLEGSLAKRQLDTAVLGSLLCVREAAHRMSRRRSASGGSIIFVTPQVLRSVGAEQSAEEAAITAARDALTTTLAKDLHVDGIRVNTVRPAAPRVTNWSGGLTNRTDRAVGPMAMDLGTYADEAAKQILWLISDEADRTTGARVEVPHKE
ncbi:MAG: SDR family NAD(P)-dependent oxidoreductase [Steroidobacteraceae bacterium]